VNAHELLTTSGALATLPPGARNHWKMLKKADELLLPSSLHAFAAIHFAPGATPIAVPPAVPPTTVPVVCVP
jgi:hypothetical protein